MSFQEDSDRVDGLSGAYRIGLQALQSGDRRRMNAEPTRRITGSVNVDTALSGRFPNVARWDYAVGWMTLVREERIHWIEVHPADRVGCVEEVMKKFSWLKSWLRTDGVRLSKYKRHVVWVASGACCFQQNSPLVKKLAGQGVFFSGRRYTIRD